MFVGVYRLKFFWINMKEIEDNAWDYPGLIVISSIAFGCLILLINDSFEQLNKISILPFPELSMFSVFIISFLFVRSKLN
jgi:hypothetical protein